MIGVLNDARRVAQPYWRQLTADLRMMPDFLIIGAQKAGTTSLHDLLTGHPGVACPRIKEVEFFSGKYKQGLRWYRSQFPIDRKSGKITFESTPYYLLGAPPEVVARDLPHVRLVAMLRNPTTRAFSHYQHNRRAGREPLSFEDALAAEDERLHGEYEKVAADPGYHSRNLRKFSYKTRGRYAEQLERWLKVFPRERLFIIHSELFFTQPESVYPQLLEFLGLIPHPDAALKAVNQGGYGEQMCPATRAALDGYFEPLNRQLYALIGRTFDW